MDTVIFGARARFIDFARAYFMVYAWCWLLFVAFLCARSCPASRTTRSTTPSAARARPDRALSPLPAAPGPEPGAVRHRAGHQGHGDERVHLPPTT